MALAVTVTVALPTRIRHFRAVPVPVTGTASVPPEVTSLSLHVTTSTTTKLLAGGVVLVFRFSSSSKTLGATTGTNTSGS